MNIKNKIFVSVTAVASLLFAYQLVDNKQSEHRQVNVWTEAEAVTQANPPVNTVLTIEPQLVKSAEDDVMEEMPPSDMQKIIYQDILRDMLNPQYVQSVTLVEVLKRMDQLTEAQKQQLIAQGKAMIARGELNLDNFKKPELPRHKTIAEGAPLPSAEAQDKFNEVVIRLNDPQYTENLTYIGLAQEIQTLPPALKQEMADKLTDMVGRGEIDAGVLLGPKYAGKTDLKFFFN